MRHLIGRLLRRGGKPGGAVRRRRRLWLGRRGIVSCALAGLACLALAGTYRLSRSGELASLAADAEAKLVEEGARLGLRVAEIEVEGRTMTSSEAILRAIGAERGTPILAISAAKSKSQLEALPWVRSAAVERRLPDTIHIRIVERTPLALWQRNGKLFLIDREGVVITGDRLDRFPGLIVTVGEDAPRHAGALIDMLASEPDLAARVAAAVRVGGRRWNLRLDNGIDVQLPEERPEEAWSQLAQLERTSKLLARDVQVVDMRLPDRLVVRVTPEPPKDPPKKSRQGAKNT